MARNYAKNPDPSPTEQALLDILKDGQAHSRDKLKMVLSDEELTSNQALTQQIYQMRRLLQRSGRDIICVYVKGETCYRMVRYINDEG